MSDLNHDKDMQRILPGRTYIFNRLVPLADTNDSTLSAIKRYKLEKSKYICALKSTDGDGYVMLDNNGSYYFTEDQLYGNLSYIDEDYKRQEIPIVTMSKTITDEDLASLNQYLMGEEATSKYKGWVSINGIRAGSVNEEELSNITSYVSKSKQYTDDSLQDGYEFSYDERVRRQSLEEEEDYGYQSSIDDDTLAIYKGVKVLVESHNGDLYKIVKGGKELEVSRSSLFEMEEDL